MTKKIILKLAEPINHIIAEQINNMGFEQVTQEIADADLIITDEKITTQLPYLLLEAPIRIGEVNDKIRYILSGRNKFPNENIKIIWEENDNKYEFDGENSQIINLSKSLTQRLTDKEKMLILALFNADDLRLDRQSLLDIVWEYAHNVETHTLETHLYRLRQKFDEASFPDLIETTNGIYQLKTPTNHQ